MVSIVELEKKLNNEKIESMYLFWGEEKYILDNCVKKIIKLFGETVKGINYIQIDESNVQEIISDIETPAFGFDKKLIIAKNTSLFKREGRKKNIEIEKLKEKIETYINDNIEELKESVVLIFIEEEADKGKLLDLIDKNGITCKFDEQKPIELQKRLKAICDMYKVNIDISTLQYFIECCGTNMQILINEIRKLIEYVGSGETIQKEDIDKLSIRQIESIIFDLTDNLGQKNVSKALEVLHNLIYTKEPIQKILITLYNHFKKLYIVKICVKYNKDIVSSLNLKPNQTFLVNKYKNQSRLFTEENLEIIINELIDLDYKYKIGLIDIDIGLEAILCAYV
ncbi:MAG: DNA polymerase III subunit delta [Clostridia bacterium]|nr:DNA polymerase III subunit delta [Clostridia bacterium]